MAESGQTGQTLRLQHVEIYYWRLIRLQSHVANGQTGQPSVSNMLELTNLQFYDSQITVPCGEPSDRAANMP